MENYLADLTPERRRAMDFLVHHLPQSDLDTYDRELFLAFVDHALTLRKDAPWCACLDEELFYHYVLFPRVNDEDLSFHREIFRSALWERVRSLPSTEEMALEVNRWCHEIASYEMQDDRTASPLTVYRSGSGRCGEESGFLVSALRSVGIPARQVYSPRWAHCDDNHAWVEALCDGVWRFLGACEPEPVIDRGWFNSPASRAVLVHSRLFGSGSHPLHGEAIGCRNGVTWFNQTARYALTGRRTLRATRNGRPAPGAVFHIQLLNEASFHTIATLTADEQGTASIELGLGDIHIFASLGEYFAECDCSAGEDAVLSLDVFHRTCDNWWETDYHAPVDAPVNPSPLNTEQKARRAAVLSRGNALREERIAAMCPPEHRGDPLLAAARGNAGELHAFLASGGDPQRRDLLLTLSAKDFRDVENNTLESHLRHLPPRHDIPASIYRDYVLCPRVALEPLTPWRGPLAAQFSEEERRHIADDPAHFWRSLRGGLSPAETYENLVWPPLAVLRSRRCDENSLRIFFVAVLRALGIPARLRREDGMPEFWKMGKWACVVSETQGELLLHADTPALYRQNWTLSRWEKDRWTLLRLDDSGWQSGNLSLTLPAGRYRLITALRLPNGNQFAAARELAVTPGTVTEAALRFRTCQLSDLLRRQQLPAMTAVTLQGASVADICRMDGRPSVLFWLEEGGEPTEHVLNELLAGQDAFARLPVNLVFLLRGRESLAQRTLANTLARLDFVQVLLDDWAYDLEQVARHLTCDPDQPPLAIVCDRDGCALYGTSGYSVGSVELLRRVAEHAAQRQ